MAKPKAKPLSRNKKTPPAPSLEWPTALKVECPTCQRKAGERCLMAGSGKESPRPHRERMKSAQKWLRLRQAEADDGSVAPMPEDVHVTPLSKPSEGKSSYVAYPSSDQPTVVIDGVSAAQDFLKSEALERIQREDATIAGVKLGQKMIGDRAFYLRVAELLEKEQANDS